MLPHIGILYPISLTSTNLISKSLIKAQDLRRTLNYYSVDIMIAVEIMANTISDPTTLAISAKISGGRIFYRDIINIYSMMIISLNLQETSVKSGGILSKSYPYSFLPKDAIKVMNKMVVAFEHGGGSKTSVVCGLSCKDAESYLLKFMQAKLLHCPADRTRSRPKQSVYLQPTAKGLHFVGRYCVHNGVLVDHITNLLLSCYNSMKCICFERHPLTDTIAQNETFILLLFQRFMGPLPNIYDASNPPDPISLNSIQSIYGRGTDFSVYSPIKQKFAANSSPSVSPYAHRYFTHPDSDALSQYYLSDKGVRLFNNKKFSNNVTERYCFTGRAAVQWLMDCTDVVSEREAYFLADLLFSSNMLAPILEAPSTAIESSFIVSKTAFYKMTEPGRVLCRWPITIETKGKTTQSPSPTVSASRLFSEITLQQVLNNAGLCFLFNEYLESNYCEENLLFFKELQRFSAEYSHLKNVLSEANEKAIFSKRCISTAYSIYTSFLAPEAPCELNIDHKLKSELRLLSSGLFRRMTTTNPIKTLDDLDRLFKQAQDNVHRLMEVDSLPKFLNSDHYTKEYKALTDHKSI